MDVRAEGPVPEATDAAVRSASGDRFADESVLVAALRAGDEDAFAWAVRRYHPSLVRVAMTYVPSRAVADEVAQETWLGVLNGIGRFEGRSSFKTWLFHILANRARTRGTRENRSIPFASTTRLADDDYGGAVDPERLLGADHPKYPRHWASGPHRWDGVPEDRLLSSETRDKLWSAIETLVPAQREVLVLRDVEGWSATEVCDALGISEVNQRVLLHRGRTKVRSALEVYLDGR